MTQEAENADKKTLRDKIAEAFYDYEPAFDRRGNKIDFDVICLANGTASKLRSINEAADKMARAVSAYIEAEMNARKS